VAEPNYCRDFRGAFTVFYFAGVGRTREVVTVKCADILNMDIGIGKSNDTIARQADRATNGTCVLHHCHSATTINGLFSKIAIDIIENLTILGSAFSSFTFFGNSVIFLYDNYKLILAFNKASISSSRPLDLSKILNFSAALPL